MKHRAWVYIAHSYTLVHILYQTQGKYKATDISLKWSNNKCHSSHKNKQPSKKKVYMPSTRVEGGSIRAVRSIRKHCCQNRLQSDTSQVRLYAVNSPSYRCKHFYNYLISSHMALIRGSVIVVWPSSLLKIRPSFPDISHS